MNDPTTTFKGQPSNNICMEVQAKFCKMQDDFISNKAAEIQAFADRKDSKHFYNTLKAICGPQPASSFPLLSTDGTMVITDRAKALEHWAEHCDAVLNHLSSINNEAIRCLPQIPVKHKHNTPPTIKETQKAISQLSSGKAASINAIPVEVYKLGGPVLTQKLVDLFQSMWEQGVIPQDFKNAYIVHPYKKKGNHQSCDNHWSISLLPIASKILTRVLLNLLTQHLEQGHLSENQCGFHAGRGHDLCIKTGSREVSRTEQGPQHHLC